MFFSQENIQEDSLLIRRSKKDSSEFMNLYKKYLNSIFGYIQKRISSKNDVEDITADVFFSALDRIGRYKDSGKPFLAWLYRIASNKIADFYRKEYKAEVISFESIAYKASADDDQLKKIETEEKVESVKMMLSKLGEADQLLVSLRYFEGLKYREIAEILGQKQGTVKMRHKRLLLKLQTMIKEVNYAI